MFCQKCGAHIPDDSAMCSSCGSPAQTSSITVKKNDEQSILLNVISLLCPLVGWVVYFIQRGEKPNKAQACCRWAWIGFAINIIVTIIGAA